MTRTATAPAVLPPACPVTFTARVAGAVLERNPRNALARELLEAEAARLDAMAQGARPVPVLDAEAWGAF